MTPGSPRTIRVLVADDKPVHSRQVAFFFKRRSESQCDYSFVVDAVETVEDCVCALRKARYDVLVLDVRFPENPKGGHDVAFMTAIQSELGWDTPIRIVITGYGSYEGCVRVMRTGAWDYILKRDKDDSGFAEQAVDSAIHRLRELDFKKELHRRVFEDWLPSHLSELETRFPRLRFASVPLGSREWLSRGWPSLRGESHHQRRGRRSGARGVPSGYRGRQLGSGVWAPGCGRIA